MSNFLQKLMMTSTVTLLVLGSGLASKVEAGRNGQQVGITTNREGNRITVDGMNQSGVRAKWDSLGYTNQQVTSGYWWKGKVTIKVTSRKNIFGQTKTKECNPWIDPDNGSTTNNTQWVDCRY